MRYLPDQRIAQNGAVAHGVLDDPVNAVRMMPAADLRSQQFCAAAFPAFAVPCEIDELVITFIQIKKRNNGRATPFRRMDEKDREKHTRTCGELAIRQV